MLRLRGGLDTGFRPDGDEPEINMAPLIDMVFILLIFFLVTTSFVREAGLEVERPRAATAQVQAAGSLVVAVGREGRIFLEGRRVELAGVRGLVERYLAESPGGAVVVAADRLARAGLVIEVLDQCRLAGASRVAVAARPEAS
ncbi:MAG: biopolymer transporter ExbD [Deltaproteobacteria bacterium]|nr:biopolymer transporter ExbD [Deltaproteobacteria bacterium]